MFIASCFAIANDSEAPESWLQWVGWRKLVFGLHANRRWHYTGPAGQPNRHVRWFCRSIDAPPPETAINLWHALVCALTGRELPWHAEAREAAEEAAAAEAHECSESDAESASAEGDGASATSSVREARELSTYKRTVACVGMVSVYLVWAIFTWCVLLARAACKPGADSPPPAAGSYSSVRSLTRHIARRVRVAALICVPCADGMLIYKLLGDEAERQFAKSWGVS